MTRRNAASDVQDLAAGGVERRKIRVADGTIATASVSVQVFPKGKQHWAYLRFKVDGKTWRKYIGNVTAESHEQSLKLGWELARDRAFLEDSGWAWVVSPRKR